LRRILIFIILLLVLASTYYLSRQAKSWHYIIPASDHELLYATSFETALDEWAQDERSNFRYMIEDGALIISASTDRVAPIALLDFYFNRFDFSVQTEIIDGIFTGNNAFGIVFRRQDARNYYVFLISGDGYYRIKRSINGRETDLNVWNYSDVINQGIGAINTLRVSAIDNQFSFYINDTQLDLCIPDNPDHISTIYNNECIGGTWQSTLYDSTHSYGQIGIVTDVHEAGRDYPDMVISFDHVIITGGQALTTESQS
jgi:hypothetical protein